jgi:hypothetical protein
MTIRSGSALRVASPRHAIGTRGVGIAIPFVPRTPYDVTARNIAARAYGFRGLGLPDDATVAATLATTFGTGVIVGGLVGSIVTFFGIALLLDNEERAARSR